MKNIIFAGVGGQGVLLLSKVLLDVAQNAGYDVKESEVHGMAQRGGSVDCHVRYGERVYSPLIQKGTADFIVSLEPLEALRKLEYLRSDGMIISNSEAIDPVPVQTGAMPYPADIEPWIERNISRHQILDAAPVLRPLGARKALNVFLLGVLSRFLEFSEEEWTHSIRASVRPKFLDMNLAAFSAGRKV